MKKIILLTSIFTSSLTFADLKPVDAYLINNCAKKITTIIKNEKLLPVEFETSNNLTLTGEGLIEAEGKKIKVYGRLFDKECKPIPNAVIKLWQNDSKGYRNYKSALDEDNFIGKGDKNFKGTGATSSDINGRFNFITIMPGKVDTDPSHINLMITHPDLEKFNTNIYFENNVSKIEEINMLASGKAESLIAVKNLEMKDDVYFIDIVIDQKVRNISY